MTVACRENKRSMTPTAIFRGQHTVYGTRFCPENQLAKDLAGAFESNSITDDGIASLRRCGIRVEIWQ